MFFGDLTHTAQLVHYWGSWVATRMLIYWHWWQHRCHQLIFRRLICSRSTRPSTSRRPVPFLRNFNPWLQLIFKNGIYVLAIFFYSILYPAVPLCWQGRWREVGKSGSASRQDPSGQLWFRKKKLAVIRGFKRVESNLQAMRLSAALQQTTFAQMELGVRSDVAALREWSHNFHVFASQQAGFKRVSIKAVLLRCFSVETHHCWQGGLDLQYLSSRYEKGKKAVAEFLDKQHSCSTYRNLTLAHGRYCLKASLFGAFPVSRLTLGEMCKALLLSTLVLLSTSKKNANPQVDHLGRGLLSVAIACHGFHHSHCMWSYLFSCPSKVHCRWMKRWACAKQYVEGIRDQWASFSCHSLTAPQLIRQSCPTDVCWRTKPLRYLPQYKSLCLYRVISRLFLVLNIKKWCLHSLCSLSTSFVQWYQKKLRALDVHELSLNFNPSSHNGDKRKTSQQCALMWACTIWTYLNLRVSILCDQHVSISVWFACLILVAYSRPGSDLWISQDDWVLEIEGDARKHQCSGEVAGQRSPKSGGRSTSCSTLESNSMSAHSMFTVVHSTGSMPLFQPSPTTGHWGYTGGDPKAPGWVGAGRSTAGVAGGLPAEQVTGLIPNVFPKHYVVFEKIRILFIVFVQTNPAVKFKSEVCGVVMGLHQDATASAGGGPECPGVSLHGSFHGWWFGGHGQDFVQRGRPFHDKLVGHKRGCWSPPTSEIQLWSTTANPGSAHHFRQCSQEPLFCFK